MISVLILTKNEERDLPACLGSLVWCDDIHVLDSLSVDRTATIARAAGAQVHSRAFDGYATQRNYGLKLPFKHSWILTVDADEIIPAVLVSEMLGFCKSAANEVGAARFRRRDMWDGRWLKYSQISPFFVRLTRVSRSSYVREVNEVPIIDGVIVDLGNYFEHYPFSKGISHWFAKHNKYSDMEAELIANNPSIRPRFVNLFYSCLTETDFNKRRVFQKTFFYRLPARPIIKFFYMLLWRRSFLDGWPGIRYAILQAIYEYLIVAKVREMNRAR